MDTKKLYCKSTLGNIWKEYKKSTSYSTLVNSSVFLFSSVLLSLSQHCLCATVVCQGNMIKPTGWNLDVPSVQIRPTILEAVKHKWMIQNILNDENYESIATQLQQGNTIMGVSDHSYRLTTKIGTAGWLIKPTGNFPVI